jgi:RND family efflux transporter MFP subunit
MKTSPIAAFAAVLMAFACQAWAAGDELQVSVRTVPLKQSEIAHAVTCYGVLTKDAGSTVTVSVSRAGQITRLYVTLGQRVETGEPLFELTTAPEANLQFQQALSSQQFSQEELRRTEDLASKHLATASQVASARMALAQAQGALDAQTKLGAQRSTETIAAPFPGVVSTLSAKQGDRVQAAASVLEVSKSGSFQVQLGVEPESSGIVKVGMPVRITAIFDAHKFVDAHITKINGLINPQTRLVDVVTSIHGAQAEDWISGMQVRGDIEVTRMKTWVVPRQAVLRDKDGSYLFQVNDGHAKRVAVRTGIETDTSIAIEGPANPAWPVVVLGNYELADGNAVQEMGNRP